MKSIILVLIILAVPGICFSDVYVYSYKDSKEIVFITEKDNVVIDNSEKDNIEKTVLPNTIEFYSLTEAYTDYKLSNKKFVLNTAKISERENEKEKYLEDGQKKQAAFESAKVKLMDMGLTSDEVDSLK
jgi:hypothetical protein